MPTHEMFVQLQFTDLFKNGKTGATKSAEKCSRSEVFSWDALLHKLQLMNVKNCKNFQAWRGLQIPEG